MFEELHIVEEQHIDGAVAVLEFVHALSPDPVDELVEELLRRDVANDSHGVELDPMVADGMEEVGLSESSVRVDEERVVVTPWLFGYGECGGMSEPIRLPNHEVVECVLRDEPRIVDVSSCRINGVDREGDLTRFGRGRDVGRRCDDGRNDGQLDIEAECIHGCLLESREVAVPDPAVVEVRRSDETQPAGLHAGGERFDPRVPCGRRYSATNLLMERLPLHGGRAWFCHLKCPASCSVSCPHTCPQGVDNSRCLGSDPIPQRRRNRNTSPGKYGRIHTSGGEYMAGSEKAARGGNLTVARDQIERRFTESLATKGYAGLGGNGKLVMRPRFRPKSVAGMFRGH